MNSISHSGRESPFAMLRRLAQGSSSAVEKCEFCSVPLPEGHRHLLEIETRKIICACDGCALRFENVIGRWKLVPRDARVLPDFQISSSDWDALGLPIHLAFFQQSTAAKRAVAMYPSPAGATESLLPLASWEKLVSANPCLAQMEPDVEALLVNRLGAVAEYYLAPIDLCYQLVGLIRIHWRGFSGGDKVWQEIERFFAALKDPVQAAAISAPEAAHA